MNVLLIKYKLFLRFGLQDKNLKSLFLPYYYATLLFLFITDKLTTINILVRLIADLQVILR